MSDIDHATWTIDSQSPQVQAVNGQVSDGYMIHFTTGQGHAGQVWVPTRNYTPAKVQAVIQAQADTMDAVGSLTDSTEV